MKYAAHYFTTCIILTFLLTLLTSAECKARVSLKINSDKPAVQDDADIFSDYEEVTIIDKATELYEKTGFVYIFITTDNTTDYKASRELESIYNEHKEAFIGKGVVLLLISTDPDNILCELQAYKTAADMFPQSICSYIEKNMINDINNGAYTNAVNTMFDELNKVYNGELTKDSVSEDNTFAKKLKSKIPAMILSVCIAFILSAVITLAAVKIGKRGCKKPLSETDGFTSDSIKKYDVYIRSIINSYDKQRKHS